MENLELFVPIKAFEGCYEINLNGDVRSISRVVNRGKSIFPVKSIILKNGLAGNGYLTVSLWVKNIGKTRTIHKMIAECFIDNPNNYKCVNHKDGNKLNNSIQNLEWCNSSQNNKHSHDSGLSNLTRKVHCIETKKEWISISNCAAETGIDYKKLGYYLKFPLRNKTTIRYK